MQLTYYGHSCFSVQFGGKHLLFDPFITPNTLAAHIDIATIKADYIIISHGHSDHIVDAEAIAKQTDATVISSWEIAQWLGTKGITKTHPMNAGGSYNFDFGTIKATVAQHSSSLPDGGYGGNPLGFVISNAEHSFYYAGDTALTMDMQLIGNATKLNFAVLPLGDNFTMGIADAVLAAKFVQCTQIVGVHYDTFGYIVINKENAKQAFAAANCNLWLPAIGETIELN